MFTLADRGEGVPLIPGDIGLSTMLRLAQLRVAVATDDMKEAARIVDRALLENGLVVTGMSCHVCGDQRARA